MGVKYRLCGIVDQDYDADNEKKMGIGRIVDQDCEVDDEKKMNFGQIVEQNSDEKNMGVQYQLC